jgi:hypothetical protein
MSTLAEVGCQARGGTRGMARVACLHTGIRHVQLSRASTAGLTTSYQYRPLWWVPRALLLALIRARSASVGGVLPIFLSRHTREQNL